MPSVLRSLAAFSFVSALAVLVAPGCSQQGEGERCDSAKNGDADCDAGLSCVKQGDLAEDITDRCCPAANEESDKRCARGVPTSGGSGGSGNTSGGAGAAGEAAGGASGPIGGAAGESSGGVPNAAGTPGTGDGGMSGAAGTPASVDGGAGGAAGGAG